MTAQMALNETSWKMHPRTWVEVEGAASVNPREKFTVVTYNILADKNIGWVRSSDFG